MRITLPARQTVPHCYVFLYGGFADFKNLCRRSYGGSGVKYVFPEYLRPVLCRLFHTINSPAGARAYFCAPGDYLIVC